MKTGEENTQGLSEAKLVLKHHSLTNSHARKRVLTSASWTVCFVYFVKIRVKYAFSCAVTLTSDSIRPRPMELWERISAQQHVGVSVSHGAGIKDSKEIHLSSCPNQLGR